MSQARVRRPTIEPAEVVEVVEVVEPAEVVEPEPQVIRSLTPVR